MTAPPRRTPRARRDFLSAIPALALGAPALLASTPGPPAESLPGPRFPPEGASGEAFWKQVREQFLLPPGEAFFNTGTLGASPRPVLDAVVRHMTHVDTHLAHWDYKPENPEYFAGYRPETELRARLGRLVSAEADEIALTVNATMGMNLVANGLPLSPGEEILMTDQEHPGGRMGWELKAKRYGCYVKQLRVPIPPRDPDQLVALFEQAITPQTRVVAVPHITSALAIVFPVEAICRMAREKGLFTVVDGAQAIGHLPIDVRRIGCDAYYASPHKWLLAPKGCGFLYVRRDRLDQLWCTLASSQWDNYKDGAFRLMQWGTANLSLLKGLEAAIDFHEALGPARVHARIRELADRLRDGLSTIPDAEIVSPGHPALACATTTYRLGMASGAAVQDALWDRARVRVRSVGEREVRHCCHIYNTMDEVDRALSALRTLPRA